MINKQSLDWGAIILHPNRKEGDLRNTVGSIRNHCYNRNMVCIIGNNASPQDFKNLKEHCPETYKGRDTITSLINVGFKKLENEWGLIVFAGTRFRQFTEWKLSTFVKDDKDILFPVVERNRNFQEAPLNGVLINKKTFEKIGEWPELKGEKDFELSKLFWTAAAVEYGCIFKAIVGLKLV